MPRWCCKDAVSSSFSLAERVIVSLVGVWSLTSKWYTGGRGYETVMKESDILLPLFMFLLLFKNKFASVKIFYIYFVLVVWIFLNIYSCFCQNCEFSMTFCWCIYCSLSEHFLLLNLFSWWTSIVFSWRMLSEGFS